MWRVNLMDLIKNCDRVLVKKKAHRSATVLTIKGDGKRSEMDGFI